MITIIDPGNSVADFLLKRMKFLRYFGRDLDWCAKVSGPPFGGSPLVVQIGIWPFAAETLVQILDMEIAISAIMLGIEST